MYQLLLKQRFKFAVRMIKRNIGAYLMLIAIVPCILILQSMIQTTHGMDIAVFIPYGILCFLFMNLFGTIPRISYYTGDVLPFVASIVIGTIQLGATIDYAILLTTKYLENRKNIYLASEEDRKKHGTDVVCCVDFILGFSNGGNSFETVYCGYDL